MDIINTGAQYKVIDLHNGRVRKVLLTHEESQAVVKSWYAPEVPPREELTPNYRKRALDACTNIQRLLDNHPELRPCFGNPTFELEGTYTQDKVRPVREVLKDVSVSRQKALVNQFIDLVLYLWQYGLSELVFNWTINNGVDEAGRIVLIDFGETTLHKKDVQTTINTKRWLRSFSYTDDLPETIQAYYAQKLAERLTLKALDETWGTHK